MSAVERPSVYLESAIVSYLVAKPSRDLVVAAHQQITHDWWNIRRGLYEMFVSQLVVEEASGGDEAPAGKRLALLEGIPHLELGEMVIRLAKALVERGPIPRKASQDAVHIAAAAVHGMDYLLTWNCRHIANVELRSSVEGVCEEHDYALPLICTPEELMGK